MRFFVATFIDNEHSSIEIFLLLLDRDISPNFTGHLSILLNGSELNICYLISTICCPGNLKGSSSLYFTNILLTFRLTMLTCKQIVLYLWLHLWYDVVRVTSSSLLSILLFCLWKMVTMIKLTEPMYIDRILTSSVAYNMAAEAGQ